jgi:hypothetical protein
MTANVVVVVVAAMAEIVVPVRVVVIASPALTVELPHRQPPLLSRPEQFNH